MSNYDGPSVSLDNLRGIIIGGVDGFKATDVTELGRIAAWLEATEMSLRSEQSKHIVRDTRKGEWPSAGTLNLWWDDGRWRASRPKMVHGDVHLWLPAPAPPEES